MANEIEMTARLYASKNGASINPQTFTATVNMTGTDMGQNTQDIGSGADELLDIAADLSLPYKVLIKNLDLQNAVYVGVSTPYQFQIPAGEFMLIPRVDANLYLKAVISGSSVKIFAQFCEI
jgi:hypothetical protein